MNSCDPPEATIRDGAILIRSEQDVAYLVERIQQAADHFRDAVLGRLDDPLALLRGLKFEPIGRHPIEARALNAIEQVNQTWTYLVAVKAAQQLLRLHPGLGGFWLAPGAHAAQALDIMSVADGVVGAETFAAVDPKNNAKLAQDLKKLAARPERYRYIFFSSPKFPGSLRRQELERAEGVEVWSLDV